MLPSVIRISRLESDRHFVDSRHRSAAACSADGQMTGDAARPAQRPPFELGNRALFFGNGRCIRVDQCRRRPCRDPEQRDYSHAQTSTPSLAYTESPSFTTRCRLVRDVHPRRNGSGNTQGSVSRVAQCTARGLRRRALRVRRHSARSVPHRDTPQDAAPHYPALTCSGLTSRGGMKA
jgi:hypothetical protein